MGEFKRLTDLTRAEFDSHGIKLSEYQAKGIESAEALAAEVSKFHPAKVVFEVQVEDGKKYYDHGVAVVLEHPTMKLEIQRSTYKKPHFSIIFRKEYKNLQYHEKESILKSLKEPNTIGVLNTKKIQDWISYYEQRHELMSKADAGNSNEIEAFLNSVKPLNPVWWNSSKTEGRIVKNGIEFTFKIENGYISKKIGVHYSVSNTLSNFIGLCDNKYIEPVKG